MKNPSTPTMVIPLVLGALLVGCSGSRPASWSYISAAIIQPNCATANCHSALSANSGVHLNDIQGGYEALVGRCFVIPGNSAQSELITLLNGRGNLRMPPDSPLPADEISLIAKWIDDGAANDTVEGGAPIGATCASKTPADAGTGQ
jgi:hypothetical protein